jgi:cytochrome c556
MIRFVLAAAVLGLGVGALVAQTDPIKARKDLMEENGKQNKIATEMLEGSRPFNLKQARTVFATFITAGEKSPDLYPDNSKEGKTAALPAIWENKSDFTARFARLAADSKAASEATKDLDTFRIQITAVGEDCLGCHDLYRRKKT